VALAVRGVAKAVMYAATVFMRGKVPKGEEGMV
jgi:hypothetical protein